MIDALAMLDYCAVHAERIYVRENLPARGWDAYALSELPVSVALGWVRKWLGEGRQPIIVRETGDSFPVGVCSECLQSPCIGHPPEPGPPHLNKTGGCSLGAVGCDRDHKQDTPAPEATKTGGSEVRRDVVQCTGDNDDGAPCRRSICAHSATTLCCFHAGHDPAREMR